MGDFGRCSMKAAVFNPYWDTLGGGERYTASLVSFLLQKNWQVDVWWPDNISSAIKDRFSIDISRANFTKLQPSKNYDLLFWLSDGSLPVSFAKKTIIHFQFPFTDVKGGSVGNFIKSRFYTFVVNSNFTKSFIDLEFHVTSRVIYPPVSTQTFVNAKKIPQIIYIGRFSNLTQSKGHATLIEVFKKIYRQIPGWKLVLAGGTTVGTDESELSQLKKSIVGLPINIVANPDFSEIKKLYSQSSLFWSASGFGVDETTTPLKVEHFGITAVEAMASGCVPLLVNKGGHKEIVQQGVNGFLWNTQEELGGLTIKLIKDNSLQDISPSAVIRSKIFDIGEFNQSFQKLINV